MRLSSEQPSAWLVSHQGYRFNISPLRSLPLSLAVPGGDPRKVGEPAFWGAWALGSTVYQFATRWSGFKARLWVACACRPPLDLDTVGLPAARAEAWRRLYSPGGSSEALARHTSMAKKTRLVFNNATSVSPCG